MPSWDCRKHWDAGFFESALRRHAGSLPQMCVAKIIQARGRIHDAKVAAIAVPFFANFPGFVEVISWKKEIARVGPTRERQPGEITRPARASQARISTLVWWVQMESFYETVTPRQVPQRCLNPGCQGGMRGVGWGGVGEGWGQKRKTCRLEENGESTSSLN